EDEKEVPLHEHRKSVLRALVEIRGKQRGIVGHEIHSGLKQVRHAQAVSGARADRTIITAQRFQAPLGGAKCRMAAHKALHPMLLARLRTQLGCLPGAKNKNGPEEYSAVAAALNSKDTVQIAVVLGLLHDQAVFIQSLNRSAVCR